MRTGSVKNNKQIIWKPDSKPELEMKQIIGAQRIIVMKGTDRMQTVDRHHANKSL